MFDNCLIPCKKVVIATDLQKYFMTSREVSID